MRSQSDLVAGLFGLSAQLVLTASGYITTVLLARSLGPKAFGVFGLIYSLLVAVELFARCGIMNATTRLMAGVSDSLPLCRRATGLTLAISGLTFALIWAAAPALARLFALSQGAFWFRLAAIDIPVFAIYLLQHAMLAGLGRFRAACALICVYALARLLAMLAVVWFWPSVEAALLANAAASLTAVLFGIAALGIRPLLPRLSGAQALLTAASPMWVSNTVSYMLPQLGLWSIPMLIAERDEAAMGLYVTALSLARVVHLVPLGLDALLLQRLAAAIRRGKLDEAAAHLQTALSFALLWLLLGCAVLLGQPDLLVLFLFGPAYGGASGLLMPLVLGIGLGHSLLLLLRTALVAIGAVAAATGILLFALVTLAAATVICVKSLGVLGAAYAPLAVLPAAAGAAAWLLARRIPQAFRGLGLLRIISLACLPLLLGWLMPAHGLTVTAQFLLAGALGLAVSWSLGLERNLKPWHQPP